MPLHTDSGDIPKLTPSESHVSRGGVPRHERLLLLGILVVVAAWIIFRATTQLLATFG
jgi:hypothetical protein